MNYFEKVEQNEGINMVKESPCKLLNFGKLILTDGNYFEGNSQETEILMVILSGRCDIKVGEKSFIDVGGRASVFDGKPHSVYIPCDSDFTVTSKKGGRFEAALCFATSNLSAEAYIISPNEVGSGKWGISNFSRNYHSILVQTNKPVKRLIVGETFTPSGNWSTYPPHRHEIDNLPDEVYMEEMYYFKISPPEGFGLTKFYTDDGAIDEVFTIKDETILMMPKGYHTVVSAPGYTTYYLWFLAGNCRIQAPVNDKNVGWVAKSIPIIRNIEDNLR